MELKLASGGLIANPLEENIQSLIEGEEFAILSVGENTYLQCAERIEQPFEYLLEFQDGSVDRHFQALDRPMTLDRVHAAFVKYLRQDLSWRSDFQWEKMNL